MPTTNCFTMQMLGRCPQCRHSNRIVFDERHKPVFRKCQSCGDLIPLGAYKVIALTNDPRNPLF